MFFRKVGMGLMVAWLGASMGVPVRAQDASPPVLYDLKGCIERALQANPQIAVARYDLEEAQSQLRSARLARTPKIELFNRSGIVNDARGDAITGDELSASYGPFNKLDLGFSLPLYTFGRISRGIDAAGENVQRRRATEFKTTSELIREACRRYFGYVLGRQLLKTTEEIRKNFSDAYDIAEERLDTGDGLVTETDALKLKVGLAVVTKNLFKVQREVQVAKASLGQVMALKEDVRFDIADARVEPIPYDAGPMASYLDQAMEDNPDIRQLKAAVASEAARYQAERSKYYPAFLAVGGLRHGVAPGRDDQDNPFLNDDFNYFSAGLSLGIKWDLNYLQTHAGVQESRVRYMRVRSQLESVTDAVTLQVKDKYHRSEEKKAALEASFEAKKAGRALLFLNMTNFKLGIGSGKDVFDALSIHARVDSEYYEAIFDYNLAVVELLNVIGRLTPDALKGF